MAYNKPESVLSKYGPTTVHPDCCHDKKLQTPRPQLQKISDPLYYITRLVQRCAGHGRLKTNNRTKTLRAQLSINVRQFRADEQNQLFVRELRIVPPENQQIPLFHTLTDNSC